MYSGFCQKTIQSCPISFQFKSHLFKMIFFVYHVTFTLPSELSWIRLVHLEHPKSPRCWKFHIESVHFWEWQNILSYFHLNPWLLIVLIWCFQPIVRILVIGNIIFQYDLKLKKSNKFSFTSSVFFITSCGRPNFTPAAAVPAKATRDPDAILRQNWWIHWIKGKKTRNPCKKKHQF